MEDIVAKLHSHGIQTDMLGQSLQVGDIVLCNGYNSCTKDTFATIQKVNKKTVAVMLTIKRYNYGKYYKRPVRHVGSWVYYPDMKYESENKLFKRPGHTMLKLSEEYMKTAEANRDSLTNLHPELFL